MSDIIVLLLEWLPYIVGICLVLLLINYLIKYFSKEDSPEPEPELEPEYFSFKKIGKSSNKKMSPERANNARMFMI